MICDKKFKGSNFVLKHLETKHEGDYEKEFNKVSKKIKIIRRKKKPGWRIIKMINIKSQIIRNRIGRNHKTSNFFSNFLEKGKTKRRVEGTRMDAPISRGTGTILRFKKVKSRQR